MYTQGSLTEGEGSVQLTSSAAFILKLNFPFLQTIYPYEEVNCTEPSPSVRAPWFTFPDLP